MASVGFDTLRFAKRLRDAGFSEVQAETVADALRESFSSGELATKTDIIQLRAELADVKAEIIKWMFGAMLAQGALVVTLVKLLPGH
jgi:hypothetical protein